MRQLRRGAGDGDQQEEEEEAVETSSRKQKEKEQQERGEEVGGLSVDACHEVRTIFLVNSTLLLKNGNWIGVEAKRPKSFTLACF